MGKKAFYWLGIFAGPNGHTNKYYVVFQRIGERTPTTQFINIAICGNLDCTRDAGNAASAQ